MALGPLTSLALRPRRSEVKPPLLRAKTVLTRGETPEVVELEANLDPLELLKAAGVAIVIGAVGLTTAWVFWEGLSLPSPFGAVRVINGAKERPFWKDQTERAKKAVELRQAKKDLKNLGIPPLLDEDPCVASKAAFDVESNQRFRDLIRKAAKADGCAWAQ